MVDNGTPCQVASGEDKICVNAACVLRSSTRRALEASKRQLEGEACTVGENACGVNGVCTADVATSATTCVCKAGWTGAGCGSVLSTCPQDCADMNREGCVSAASCGACKLGFAARSPNLGEDDACAFAYPQPLRATAALITPTPTTAGEVELAVTFGARFTLSFYRLVSGNSHPSQDPTSWVLEGRTSGVSAWEPLDAQRGVLFGARHQTMTFPIKSAVWPAPTYTQASPTTASP